MDEEDIKSPWIKDAHKTVNHLFKHNSWIYVIDLLLTYTTGIFLLYINYTASDLILKLACFGGVVLCFYRVFSFIHEIAHFKGSKLQGFKWLWMGLVGIPFLLPYSLYTDHVTHHSQKNYGTKTDGEFLPFTSMKRSARYLFLMHGLFNPLLLVFRYGILTPLGYINRQWREQIYRCASAAVIDPSYKRLFKSITDFTVFKRHECICFLYLIGVITLSAFQYIPLTIILYYYLIIALASTLNAFRTAIAHVYHNPTSDKMTFENQFFDSINITSWPFIHSLWAPVGLRFHALHHLFPSMPYHHLGKAHQLLIKTLPENSPYHTANRSSAFQSICCYLNGK